MTVLNIDFQKSVRTFQILKKWFVFVKISVKYGHNYAIYSYKLVLDGGNLTSIETVTNIEKHRVVFCKNNQTLYTYCRDLCASESYDILQRQLFLYSSTYNICSKYYINPLKVIFRRDQLSTISFLYACICKMSWKCSNPNSCSFPLLN